MIKRNQALFFRVLNGIERVITECVTVFSDFIGMHFNLSQLTSHCRQETFISAEETD